MPLSSAEIAGLSGQYQGLYQQQMQYSGMIGGLMTMSGPPQLQGEQAMGGMMNRIGGIAGPAASFGLGLAGMDPLSLGLKAGMGTFAAGGGIAGGAAMGLGVAGAAALPLMAAQYMGGQMMTGAQQQQQFNSAMRGSFGFNTPFGQGFSTSQLGTIGSDLRGMAGQIGPAGEMTSFRELAGLAANMGRMGMATGVRDVQQFKQRFSEMLNTVKTIATEMGTSLQQAQEAMASMRGSGIFRSADQVKFAMQMRQYSVAGGLSTSELGAMGNIGSQISRSVGGRGAAGAFAGMRTLGTIGSALQTGTLNEEDIYNATGLYGAEGRQALATRQLENSANFLRSSRGRWFLASVAGQNGQLDASSVNAWMGGGMGVNDTRNQAHRNLGRVGRANFIRNEGRLRGAAMEQFGGLMPAMALNQWAEEKGIDIGSMGDREMLFASRQLGMGMDELEATMKEARNLPRLMQSQQMEGQIDQQLKTMANRRRTQGLEGVKRKLEQAREQVQNGLQQLGADFYSTGSDMIERFVNRMAGTYVEDFNADAVRAFKGSRSMAEFQRSTGIGRTSRLGAGGGFGGGMGPGGMSASFFGENPAMTAFGNRVSNWLTGTDYDKATQAGFGGAFAGVRGMAPGAARDAALQRAAGMTRGFYANMANPNATPSFSFNQDLIAKMGAAYAEGLAGKQGADRADALEQFLAKEAPHNTEAAAALKQLRGASPEMRGAIALGIERSGKVATAAQISQGQGVNVGDIGKWASRGEQQEAYGAAIMGQESWSARLKKDLGIGAVGGGAAIGMAVVNPLAMVGAAAAAGYEGIKLYGMRRQQMAAGAFALSAQGKAFARSMAFGTKDEFNQAFNDLQSELQATQLAAAKDPSNTGLQDTLQMQSRQFLAARVIQRAAQRGGSPTDDDIKAVLGDSEAAKKYGITADQLNAAIRGIGGQAFEDRVTSAKSIQKVMGKEGEARKEELLRSGMFNSGVGGLALSPHVSGAAAKDSTIAAYAAMVGSEAALSGITDPTALLAGVGTAEEKQMAFQRLIQGQGSRQLLAGARSHEAMGLYGLAREERMFGGAERGVERSMRRLGAGGALASILGVGVSRDNIALLRGMKGGASESQITELLSQAGIDAGKNKDLVGEISAAMGKTGQERVAALANLKLGDTLAKAESQKSADQDRAKNPTLASIDDSLKEMKDALTTGQVKVKADVTNPDAIGQAVSKADPAGQPGQGNGNNGNG